MNFSLEDSTTERLPLLLEDIVRKVIIQYNTCDSCQRNLMYVLILFIMIENGYQPLMGKVAVDINASYIAENLKKWHTRRGTFEVEFVMCGFDHFPVRLIVTPLGATVLVNLIIAELDSETYSACLPISRYVVSPQASTISMIFRDLRHLSITLKNKILSAVKSRLLSYHGHASASLIGLPEELLYSVIMYLPINDIINVRKSCKRLHYLLNKEIIWHMLCKRDFAVDHCDSDSWQMLYQKKYDEKKRLQHANTMYNLMDYADLVPYVDNPFWGDIV